MADTTAWAKVQDPTDTERLAALREETRRDRHEYLAEGLSPVDCLRCGNRVLVKKHSPLHTSIQWTTSPVAGCAEFAERAAAGERTELLTGCGALAGSIEQAVREGRVEVTDG